MVSSTAANGGARATELRRPGSGRFEETAALSAPLGFPERILIAIIAVMFALALHRSFITNVNWDEFYYLANVHLYRRGMLSMPLQSFHVHLFGWLPLFSDDELHQIFAARVALWLLSIVSCWLIFAIARRFCSRLAALLSVLFYFGFSYVVDHGPSFRSDPICAFLFLGSLYVLLDWNRSPYRIVLSGALLAVAMMITIKSVIYLGTIGTIFVGFFLVEADKSAIAKKALIFIAAFAGSLAILYYIHGITLAGAAASNPATFVRGAGEKTLLAPPFLPRINIIRNALFQNGPIWVLVALGLAKAGYELARGRGRRDAVILLSFAVPLLSLLIYRNAYPYFFVFLMPAVVILGGYFADVLIARWRIAGSRVAFLVLAGTVLMVSGSVLGDYIRRLPDQTVAQAEVIATVHRMFPEPVTYIDRNSMIASFPKVGFFMSTWGMESYLSRHRPIMEDLIRREQPKFLLANSCALELSRRADDDPVACPLRLLDEDLEALRANFVHHWGAIYVAGKSFDLVRPSEPQTFEILIPGVYTLEAGVAVSIDGETYRPGDPVSLDRTTHEIAATGEATRALLRWGERLYRPDHGPSRQPLYQGF